MIFGSVCSGIEAASVAWGPLGWTSAFFAEIEAFPSAVLAHHYPDVPNLGDFTRIGKEVPCAAIDLLVGGTPCQAFSVAGLRAGLADPRGNLALEFLALADRLRPRWLVWENVPGVLSSLSGDPDDPCPPPPPVDMELDGQELETEDDGEAQELHALNCFLAGLSECGYGWALRVLDAQHFGVPQRRRRVFVVGHLGAWQPAAAVLLEPESMRGDPPPSRASREGVARPLGSSPAGGSGYRNDADTAENLIARALTASANGYRSDGETETLLAHALTGEGFDASEDGTGRGTPLVTAPVAYQLHGFNSNAMAGDGDAQAAIPADVSRCLDQTGAFAANQGGTVVAFHGSQDPDVSGDVTHPLSGDDGFCVSVAFDETQITSPTNRCRPEPGDPCHPLAAGARPPSIASLMSVRRLTPRECERLQGFPDDYTAIPQGGGVAKDGPRYRALGNSMAVPVMRWIGERVAAVDVVFSRRAHPEATE